ncbi:MAG: hypothetical protein H0T13_01035 [Actinobacteria bacterium]|nr:hypothetical protein [Actinomycetota bacterium]
MQLASIYSIDADDVVTSFRGGLGPPDDAPPPDELVGRSLYDFVAGLESAELYRLILAGVRSEQRPAEIPFRCDGPHVRRFMSLSIVPDGDTVGFRAFLERSEPRPDVAVLSAAVERDERLLRMCSWCKQVDAGTAAGSEWVEVEVAVDRLGLFQSHTLPQITHGICGRCAHDVATWASPPACSPLRTASG